MKDISYQGNTSVDLNLADIEVGKLRLNLSIHYMASGIKFNQKMGEMGIGWVLQPNFRVSREINGSPDEATEFQLNFADSLLTYQNNFKQRDYYLGRFINFDKNDLPYRDNIILDSDYDIFSYSTPNGSGKFFIDFKSGLIKQLSGNLDKITFERINGKIVKFKIMDVYGGTYIYGRKPDGIEIIETIGFGGKPIGTSWMLVEGFDNLGSKIQFEYKTAVEYGQSGNETITFINGGLGSGGVPELGASIISQTEGADTYHTFRLTQLNLSNGINISFNRNTDNTVNSIEIVKNSILEKKISFEYNGVFFKRYTLFEKNLVNHLITSFDYIDENNYASQMGSGFPDYWGYYKSAGISISNHFIPPIAQIRYCDIGINGYTSFESLDNYIWFNRLDKTVLDNGDSKKFSLKSIQFPTKGILEIEYESGKYSVGGEIKYAGIRIKRLTKKDRGIIKYIKEFSYGQNENGLGIVDFDLAHSKYYVEEGLAGLGHQTSVNLTPMLMARKLIFRDRVSDEFTPIYNQVHPIKYHQVSEKQLNENLNPIGKTVYNYELTSQFEFFPFLSGYQDGYLFYGINNSHFSNALAGSCTVNANVGPVLFQKFYKAFESFLDPAVLVKKAIFKFEHNTYSLVEENIYEYKSSSEYFEGLKVRRLYSSNHSYSSASDYYSQSKLNSLFSYGTFRIEGGKFLLSKQITKSYHGELFTIDSTMYEYNSFNQIYKSSMCNSAGNNVQNYFTYPTTYGNNVSWINNLVNNNFLNNIIESVKVVNNHISYGVINQYDENGKGLLTKSFKLEVNPNRTFSNFKFSNFPLGVLPTPTGFGNYLIDSKYKLNSLIQSFDSYGNPREVREKSGPVTVYLWGYIGQFPIAKIENSTYAEVLAALGSNATTILNSLNSSTVSDATIDIHMTTLRNSLKNARVTSYTYSALVGMTSMTDPRGIRESYQYDGFQRLKSVLDFNNNIIKNYQYNYRTN
ncbi:hypothetical protein [Sphingobacterium cellulitidis]|nr:hypothetical protein [Sphingobacterium soli]MBA8986161.1 hypothetical protein [Sphingobacterium soli]